MATVQVKEDPPVTVKFTFTLTLTEVEAQLVQRDLEYCGYDTYNEVRDKVLKPLKAALGVVERKRR